MNSGIRNAGIPAKFAAAYRTFTIWWSGSSHYPINRKGLVDVPEAGFLEIDGKTGQGVNKLVFTRPGTYGMAGIYKKIDGTERAWQDSEGKGGDREIVISPTETIIQIRNGNLTYALSVFVLAIMMFQILGETWKLN